MVKPTTGLNHSTRDSDTRWLGHTDIACVDGLPVYECCVARFSANLRSFHGSRVCLTA
jgi:hypothetical protein